MNRTQAKILAPIICAFAAGSNIQARDPRVGAHWYPFHATNLPIENAIELGLELRIAPKPPKPKFARLALCNLDKVDANNVSALPYVVQIKAAAINEPGWIPAEVIVRKGHCDKFAKHPAFVKWLTADFQLLTGNNTHADNQRHA